MTERRLKLFRRVAQLALRNIDELTAEQRADVYEGVAHILSGAESEAAKLAAFSLRESEQHQLKFRELLKS